MSSGVGIALGVGALAVGGYMLLKGTGSKAVQATEQAAGNAVSSAGKAIGDAFSGIGTGVHDAVNGSGFGGSTSGGGQQDAIKRGGGSGGGPLGGFFDQFAAADAGATKWFNDFMRGDQEAGHATGQAIGGFFSALGTDVQSWLGGKKPPLEVPQAPPPFHLPPASEFHMPPGYGGGTGGSGGSSPHPGQGGKTAS